MGLSPPTRGSHTVALAKLLEIRSIPAHAGEPRCRVNPLATSEVYPRPRGGAGGSIDDAPLTRGLSPPTRGSLPRLPDLGLHEGSIPAHAGEPRRRRPPRSRPRVYPRPRGGAVTAFAALTDAAGLSPPTRGSHRDSLANTGRARSIPAHAGEAKKAYILPDPVSGLSPPTRGSHVQRWSADLSEGSIPAHAGEPVGGQVLDDPAEVYPRPRGGADAPSPSSRRNRGLSPPTRGSRLPVAGRDLPRRSIPAHAGEPSTRPRTCRAVKVYPRPRGGAIAIGELGRYVSGLSPPTRGSRRQLQPDSGSRGSIPAHAGEPHRVRQGIVAYRVYPRPRGGASPKAAVVRIGRGLSPPTRGSLRTDCRGYARQRSIPAHAGEPDSGLRGFPFFRVYPRPRGGARRSARARVRSCGLSPPTRGSRLAATSALATRRSIPAHAGEPTRCLTTPAS